MKAPTNYTSSNRPAKFARTLALNVASAAVILSLTACGADTLGDIQTELANGDDVDVSLSLNDDGDLVLSLNDGGGLISNDDADAGSDDGAGSDGDSTAAAGGVTVTLTNTSAHQPMTPPIVVLHNAPDSENGMRLFYPTQPASDAIIAIAENGNNGPMVEQLGFLTEQGRASAFAVGFADPANPGPLLPGMSAEVTLDVASADQVMSIVSMVVCTNDGFSAANAHTLSDDASETFMAPIYDAGSETNVLTADYFVPPCGSADNFTDDENGSVMLHPGQSGAENPDFDFEAGTRLLEVTITRN